MLNRLYTPDFQRRELAARRLLEQQRADYRAGVAAKLARLQGEGPFEPATLCDDDIDDLFCALDLPEYRFVTFRELAFGQQKAASADDFLDVSGIRFAYCDFSECTFSNVRFKGCTFVGCRFLECFTNGLGAAFFDCDFKCLRPGEKSVDDLFCAFEGCEMRVSFAGCNLEQAIFDKTNLYFSQLRGSSLRGALFCDCAFDTVCLAGDDLRGMKLVGARLIEFSVEDAQSRTRVDRHSFFGAIVFDPKNEREVRFAIEAYNQFYELFRTTPIAGLSGEYFYLFKKTELLQREGLVKAVSVVGLLSCGYGERPFFALALSLALVVVFGFIYLLVGVHMHNEFIAYRPSLDHPLPEPAMIVQCLHHSASAFFTPSLGQHDSTGLGVLVSVAERVLGIIMIGVFVSTLVRKMAR